MNSFLDFIIIIKVTFFFQSPHYGLGKSSLSHNEMEKPVYNSAGAG